MEEVEKREKERRKKEKGRGAMSKGDIPPPRLKPRSATVAA